MPLIRQLIKVSCLLEHSVGYLHSKAKAFSPEEAYTASEVGFLHPEINLKLL
jgi:hypothetical protein